MAYSKNMYGKIVGYDKNRAMKAQLAPFERLNEYTGKVKVSKSLTKVRDTKILCVKNNQMYTKFGKICQRYLENKFRYSNEGI